MHNILVIEDDNEMSSVLVRFLQQEGFGVHHSKDGQSFSEKMLSSTSLVLLDINLPGENGFDVARRIRAHCPTVGIIFLTGRADLVDRVVGLELGADDYVQKPFELRELLARVRAVIRRTSIQGPSTPEKTKSNPEKVKIGGWVIYAAGRKVVAPCGRSVELTTTEFAIMHLLGTNNCKTVTRQMLSEFVRGKDWDPLDRTLDGHVAHLRKKLATVGGADLIKSVHGQGYVIAVD